MEDLGRGGEEKKRRGGGFVLYSEVDSEQRPRFLFFRSGGVGGRVDSIKGQRESRLIFPNGEEGGREGTITSATENLSGNGRQACRWTGKERESDVKKRGTDERMERKDDTERERKKGEREKKDIASRWTRRLAFTVSEASLAANGERGFRPCVERRWERAEWREREREQLSGMVGQFKRKIQKVN